MSKGESKPNFVLKFQGTNIPIHLKNTTTDQDSENGSIYCSKHQSGYKQKYVCEVVLNSNETIPKEELLTIGQIDERNYEGIPYSAKEKKAYLDAHTPQEIIVETQEPLRVEDFHYRFFEYVSTEKYEIYDNELNHETIEQLREFVRGKIYTATIGKNQQIKPAILTATREKLIITLLLDNGQIKKTNQNGHQNTELLAEKQKIKKEAEYYLLKQEGKPIDVKTEEQVIEQMRVKLDLSKFK